MLYERIKGPVRPFHEDEKGYIFRFFCGDSLSPTEQSMPKGDKRGYAASAIVKPNPFLAIGRVHTFQSSIKFWDTKHRRSPRPKSASTAARTREYSGSFGSSRRRRMLVSVRKGTHRLSRDLGRYSRG
jgi:hypothetical protein